MAQAVVIRTFGGPEVLVAEEVAVAPPGPGEVRIQQRAIGVNFHDCYVRSGMYDTLTLPGIPGCEAAGVVTEIGPEVDGLRVGDRIGYVTPLYGASASERVLPAALAIPIPGGVEDDVVAANLLRATTVDMLTRHVVQVQAGMTVLVHAAAGGVGRLLCQMAAHLGATVLGTVGSEAKAAVARAAGCAEPILYREVDFVSAVQDLAPDGVDVVYDAVGADTFDGSLAVLGIGGHLVNYGQSSGAVAPLAMSTLATKSLVVSRPIIFHYLRNPQRYQEMGARALNWLAEGPLVANEVQSFALDDAASAHRLLEARNPSGRSIILTPN